MGLGRYEKVPRVATNQDEKQIDQLVRTVLKSSKYKNVCDELVKNIGMHELSKHHSLKEAVKSTKNKLHQIGGAYFLRKPKYGFWLETLKSARNSGSVDVFRRTCAEIMDYHSSTRDRLSILDQFYARIFSSIPPIHLIMDIACGFNPLSIPWMPLSHDAEYFAYDVYTDLMGFLNEFMSIADIHGHAEAKDIIQNPPEKKADLAFILNAIPCLEQIEKSAGLKVLESINANFLVVSFPVRSLCGKEKSMRKHYEARFKKLTKEKEWTIKRLEFSNELVFVVSKKQ